jgi:hypothetical protein
LAPGHGADGHLVVIRAARDLGLGSFEVLIVFNDAWAPDEAFDQLVATLPSYGRGSFTCRAIVSDDARAGVPVAPMGWWNRDYAGGHSPQATTPQRLTTLRDAPTFNDNRVEISRILETPASDSICTTDIRSR